MSDLTKKRCYWPKGVPWDLIDNNFGCKEASDVLMIEKIIQDNKLFIIFCMKDPDCVMEIMSSCMTPDEL